MPIRNIGEKEPRIHQDTFIAPGAYILGDVSIGQGSSVWFYTVIRGDLQPIVIGENTNIQDHTVIHTSTNKPTIIGNWVTIGHRAVLHSTNIGDNCLIGIGSVILDDSIIGENSVVGANTLVSQGKEFPSCSLILGNPAKLVRTLTPDEIERFKGNARRYEQLWRAKYAKQFND